MPKRSLCSSHHRALIVGLSACLLVGVLAVLACPVQQSSTAGEETISLFVGLEGAVLRLDPRTGHIRSSAVASSTMEREIQPAGELLLYARGPELCAQSGAGEFRWARVVGDRWISPPAVGEGVAALAFADGDLICVDLRRGELRWRVTTDRVFSARPAIGNGLVFAAGTDGGVEARKLDDGELVWTLASGSRAVGGAAVAHGEWLVVVRGAECIVYDADSGERQWARPVSPLADRVAIQGRTLVVGRGRGLVAHDVADGTELWSREPADTLSPRAPVIAGERVFFASGCLVDGDGDGLADPDTLLYAVSIHDGAVLWRARVPGRSGGAKIPHLAASEEIVVIVTHDGALNPTAQVHAFGAARGERNWSFERGCGGSTAGVCFVALAEDF